MAAAAILVRAPGYPPSAGPVATAASKPRPAVSPVTRAYSLPLVANQRPQVPSLSQVYLPFIGSQTERLVSEPTPPPATPTPARAAVAPTRTPVKPKPSQPVPTPPRVLREPITKVTKLGVGVYGLHASDSELESLLRIQPSVLVLQDPDIDFARKVRYYFPKAFIIGRTFLASQPLDNPEQRGIALADKVAELAVPRQGLIDAWQGYNEPVAHNDYAGYEAYNRLQVAFAQRLQGHYGIPAVAGNDPPGAVEPSDYPKYFAEAIRASQYFGIHAYSKPDNYTLRTEDAAYYALRYRLIHDELEKAGLHDVQMVITEVGLANGWRYKVTPEEMAAQYFWLTDELEKDPYMIGMAIYGLFHDKGVSGWQDHDIKGTGLVDLLGTYQPRRRGEAR
mgnify:CR=1 FL=1